MPPVSLSPQAAIPVALNGRRNWGGKRAYRTRIGKDRSTRHSCRSIATPKHASPPEVRIHRYPTDGREGRTPAVAKLLSERRVRFK
jgi:hypothetical protein